MARKLLIVIFCLSGLQAFSQDSTLTDAEKKTLDSMISNDVFLQMLQESGGQESYWEVGISVSNAYFSSRNKRINSSQIETKAVFTPSVSYYHKSGLGISGAAYLINDNGRSDFYQYSITPSYSLQTDRYINASISYTRFFRKKGYEEITTPIQNEIYGSAYLKKPWIQPGLSLGYSQGKSTTYKTIDTVFNNIRRILNDTLKISNANFSAAVYVQHSFEYFKILGKKDAVSIMPQLSLNMASNRYSETHRNPFLTRLKARPRFKNAGSLQQDADFGLQSVSMNLDIHYLVGKFSFKPQAYIDYYLPSTTDNRFSSTFSFSVLHSF